MVPSRAACLAVVASLAPTVARADEGTSGRVLAGHAFVVSALVPAPFAVTEVGLTTGLGIASASAPEIDDAGRRVGTRTYRLGALSQSFGLRIAPIDAFGLHVGLGGSAIVGTDWPSALVLGAFFGYSLSGGAVGTVALGRLRLSASFDAGLDQFYSLTVVGAIVESIEKSRVDASTLLQETTQRWLAPGAQIAVALHRVAGAWLDVRYRHDFTTTGDRSTDVGSLSFGAAVSIDLAPLAVPVGTLATYALSLPLEGEAGATHTITAGLFYTGRRALLVGVDGRAVIAEPAPSIEIATYEAVFGLRYFW